jgi:hypothetical protein
VPDVGVGAALLKVIVPVWAFSPIATPNRKKIKKRKIFFKNIEWQCQRSCTVDTHTLQQKA